MESTSEAEITLNALSINLAHVVEQVSPSVIAVNARRHLASSGVYWRDGIIVTAAHTVRCTDDISVILRRDGTVPATVAGFDSSRDLALLKIDSAELYPPLSADA